MIDGLADALLGAAKVRPYYGRAFAALTPVAVDWVETIAVTRAWHLLVNESWWSTQPHAQRVAVIAGHEIEHLLRGHCDEQLCGRDKHVFSIAKECEINDDCPDLALPPGGHYPSIYGLPDGLSRYEYYDRLLASGAAGAPTTHASGAGQPHPREVELPPGVPDEAVTPLLDAVAADVVRAAGSAPSHARMWAEARAARARVPLPLRIARAVRGATAVARGRDEYSWSRMARRYRGIARPGMVRVTPRVAVVVDTSGSMNDNGPTVLAAVRSAVRAYDVALVVACDAGVQSISRNIPREWNGGGGTDLTVGISAALRCHPDAIVVITDGFTPWPEAAPVPVVAVCTTGTEVPDYAHAVRVTGTP